LPAAAYLGGPSDVCLWQQFVGLEVDVTDGPEFDLGVMTMMDFRTPQRGEIRFAYVLPYSSRSALVELTGFVGSPQDPAVFEADLNDYLVRVLGVKAWHVGRTERGMIPMTTATLPYRATDRVTRIGAAGGMVKPSNGYAFDAIQRQSRQIAESFVGGTVDGRPPVRAISLALDRIFMSYLSKYPERAPELFMRIAAGVGPERFARFMMNRGSYIDDLAVIASMPKWPFICEAVVSRRAWFKSGGGLASRYRVKSMEKGRPAPVSQ
jgi:lycopene beta-cyclase